MIVSIEIFLGVGAVAGWFAYKALLRIAAWGHAMNQQDANFRAVTDQEIDGALRRVHALQYDNAPSDAFHAQSASVK